jgi:hypothetical protein
MLRVLLLSLAALLVAPAVLAAPDDPPAAKAKGKGSKGNAGKKKGEPRAAERPEGSRADPRAGPTSADVTAADVSARRGMGRIEFDDRLIQGQTNKANAIYLFERRESALRSLLKKRTSFHEEIDETLE